MLPTTGAYLIQLRNHRLWRLKETCGSWGWARVCISSAESSQVGMQPLLLPQGELEPPCPEAAFCSRFCWYLNACIFWAALCSGSKQGWTRVRREVLRAYSVSDTVPGISLRLLFRSEHSLLLSCVPRFTASSPLFRSLLPLFQRTCRTLCSQMG